jgi:cell division protein FtsB
MEETSRRWFTGKAKWLASVALVLVAFYLLAVTPLRTYIQQQHQMHQAEQRYEILAGTNKQLQDRVTQLQSDDEIKKLAREKYELVEPGQQAYAVMPPSPAITQPAQEQAQALEEQAKKKKGLPERVWNAVNPWS